jgi:DNA (cytosine-5)-methyltransferase 1
MAKSSACTVTDLFCGAGGASEGARRAGAVLRLGLNHWNRAVETHNANFPDADHDCTDASACDPRRYPSTTIFIGGPECTNHSLSKGKGRHNNGQLSLLTAPLPEEDRSRATMWDVPRFAEIHKYEILVVENVVDARYWGLWDAWIHAMDLLGYKHRCLYLNSMFFPPTPQSRDRLYVVFWKKGNPVPDLDFTPDARCHVHGSVKAIQSWKNPYKPWGKYKAQYLYVCPECGKQVKPAYYPASSVIDWSLATPRIGDRKRPLAPKTIRRIEEGLNKFSKKGFITLLRGTSEQQLKGCSDSLDEPLATLCAGATHHGLVVPKPFMFDWVAEGRPRAITDPLSTVVGGGNHHFLTVPPGITIGDHSPEPPQDKPPSMAQMHQAMLTSYYGNGQSTPTSDPVGTVTTKDRFALVQLPEAVEEISAMDCGFRMLQPHELQLAMAFPDSYIFLNGPGKEKVRLLGNAVTPPVMEWIIKQCVRSLEKSAADCG